jgi:hypothetical protein
MSTSIIIVSVIIAFCLFFPIYLFSKIGKSNTRNMLKKHLLEAAKYNLTLIEKEHWGNSFIGIDPNQNSVLFIKTIPKEDHSMVIPLIEIKKCNILKVVKPTKVVGKTENLLEKVTLEFVYFANNKPNLSLNFYDIDGDFREDFEMRRAEKWVNLINNQIHLLQKTAKVA